MSIGTDKLKHIVVLMMENRSFDHMLGFAQSDSWPIDGLSEKKTNVDSAGGVAEVSKDAGYAGDLTPDPGHSTFETLTQLYGDPSTSVTQNPAMSGFVRSYEGKTGNPQAAHRIMKCFSAQNAGADQTGPAILRLRPLVFLAPWADISEPCVHARRDVSGTRRHGD
jgi:hypothetical protein